MMAAEPCSVCVCAEPDKDRFAHDMILGNEAPVARVGRTMAIVALHPVVIHLESIVLGFFSIDIDTPLTDLEVVALINLDGTLVNGDIIECKSDGLALFRNPDWSVIVTRPMLVTIERVNLQITGIRINPNTLYKVFTGL